MSTPLELRKMKIRALAAKWNARFEELDVLYKNDGTVALKKARFGARKNYLHALRRLEELGETVGTVDAREVVRQKAIAEIEEVDYRAKCRSCPKKTHHSSGYCKSCRKAVIVRPRSTAALSL